MFYKTKYTSLSFFGKDMSKIMERQLRDSSCSEKRKAKWFFWCWHELRKREIMYDNHNDNINKEVHCHAYTSSLFL